MKEADARNIVSKRRKGPECEPNLTLTASNPAPIIKLRLREGIQAKVEPKLAVIKLAE